MADTLTVAERSVRMSRVRSKGNRSTEGRLISLMRAAAITGWRRGVPLAGKPDFVFRAAKVAVFVDGCFWHGCPRHRRVPKSNIEFWKTKLAANVKRDRAVTRELRAAGWKVLRLWECSLTQAQVQHTIGRLRRALSPSGRW